MPCAEPAKQQRRGESEDECVANNGRGGCGKDVPEHGDTSLESGWAPRARRTIFAARGGDLRFQISDFRKMASYRAERGEKGVRLGTGTPGGDRRFQITDFRDARTGGDKALADTHLAAI